MALSTLKPATSPRLSVIKLEFVSPPRVLVEDMIAGTGNDLRRIAGEVARIEHEFEGVVNFTVLRDSRFGAVLDTLKVRFRFVGDLAITPIHLRSFLADPSTPHSLKWAVVTPTSAFRPVILRHRINWSNNWLAWTLT